MKIKWMSVLPLYFLISAFILIPGVFSLIKWELNPSIDFTGGTLLEITIEVREEKLEQTIYDLDLDLKTIKQTSKNTYLLRFPYLEEKEKEGMILSLERELHKEVEVRRWESLGPSLGKELLTKTGIGILIALLAILLYINSRFKDKSFGICAVLAMIHDSLILLGSFSLLGHFLGVEVGSLFVTALLTSLSLSVHDTVVIYDRLRELTDLNPKRKFEKVADSAINQSIVRSINDSLTIIFMLLSLLFFGAQTIKWFVVALLIGTLAGTYSATFTAIPLLVVWKKFIGNNQ